MATTNVKRERYDGPAISTGRYGDRPEEVRVIEQYRAGRNNPHGPYHVTCLASTGDKWYPKGVWRISYKDEMARLVDAEQLAEIHEALTVEFDEDKFNQLAQGVGVTFGPMRVGKPPIDKLGIEIEEFARDTGDWGPLGPACRWIEVFDGALVHYSGKDAVWPNGCWTIQVPYHERQLVNRDGILHIAHKVLGMPYQEAGPTGWRARIEKEIARRKGTGSSFPKPVKQAPADDLEALFGGGEEDMPLHVGRSGTAPIQCYCGSVEGPFPVVMDTIRDVGQQEPEKYDQTCLSAYLGRPGAAQARVSKASKRVDDSLEDLFAVATPQLEEDLEDLFGVAQVTPKKKAQTKTLAQRTKLVKASMGDDLEDLFGAGGEEAQADVDDLFNF